MKKNKTHKQGFFVDLAARLAPAVFPALFTQKAWLRA